jgi:segregation and condensation protein B
MSSDRSENENEFETRPAESDDQELSLASLSRAYAQVMREREGGFDCHAADVQRDAALELSDSDSPHLSDPSELGPQGELQETIDNEACPVSPHSIVEAILFVGTPQGVKLPLKKIAAAMRDVSPNEVKAIIEDLNRQYVDEDFAFRIVNDAGNYKIQLVDDLAEVQNYFFGRNRGAKLSQPAIDVLAIVAYNQPLTRQQLDETRGKISGGVLAQLVRRGLIAENEFDGRTTYQTTDRFLELFGLTSLEDLPQANAVTDLDELSDS